MISLPKMVSIREASKETGLTYCHLRSLCLTGRVACVRAGNTKWLINSASLAEYLSGCGTDESDGGGADE